ncbi:interleukin-18 receptor accessory protein-like [Centropristis striata]|uniref:interleukin-18 receptor accessory protein-like n=1 Tax=Centropristis striata TaxID=184440 RepID=UPI0027E0A9FA|nr:interleukin-18 receptor accessory protein-like [Centropristis striata]
MLTGFILGFFIFPIHGFLEGCCLGDIKRKRPDLGRKTPRRYRAVEGEIFLVTCFDAEVKCFRTGEGNESTSLECGKEFLAEAKHSGNYTCSGSKLFFHLQVVQRTSVGCFQTHRNNVNLPVTQGGKIPCPGLRCGTNTDVTWYTRDQHVDEQHQSSCQENGHLQLCEVRTEHTGIYFCDKQISEQGVRWTFRTAVEVTAIIRDPPRISPYDDNTAEVELGRPNTLLCKVVFHNEVSKSRFAVQWFINDGDKMEKIITKVEREQNDQVIGRANITPQHLEHTYTCIANDTFGTSNITIKLKEKVKDWVPVKWLLVGYLTAPLLLVAGLGFVLHEKWLEIQLIYRSHFQSGKYDGDEKEFDVFLSYVWSPSSAEMEGGLTPDLQKDPDDEACLGRRPLAEQLPAVLEELWGYQLCLLDRDMLPGGVYTDDVALAIQRSQMLICLLSADFLSSSSAVFVLESGVKALLQNSSIKVLLIWTSRAASLSQLDPPLPTLVLRALKVLPTVFWPSGRPATATTHFWRSLKKAVPKHKVKLVSVMQEQ